MKDATDIDPKELGAIARVIDPANYLLEYFHELHDHGQTPGAITHAVVLGLADFIRDIEEPELLVGAIQLIAEELLPELQSPPDSASS